MNTRHKKVNTCAYNPERFMEELASTVFTRLYNGSYIVTKSRSGDVVLGGLYSEKFVKHYARNFEDVYIKC